MVDVLGVGHVEGRIARTPPVWRSAGYALLLPPVGPGSVTGCDPAPWCASPSPKPACGLPAHASACRPFPDGSASDETSRPWKRMPCNIPTTTLPRDTASLAPAMQPLAKPAVDR